MPRARRAVPASEKPADETRDRIIEAAQAVFARDGFVGAKMQEIADRVGIQRPSLFYHFRNKEALFVAAHERVFARMERLFRESLVSAGNPFVQLDRVTRAALGVMAEEPDFARMVARTAVDRHPQAVAIVRSYLRPLVDLAAEFVRQRQAEKIFRADVDPYYFTLNSWGAALLHFTARDLLAPAGGGADDLGRFTRTLLQMGNRALTVPPQRERGRRRAPSGVRGGNVCDGRSSPKNTSSSASSSRSSARAR